MTGVVARAHAAHAVGALVGADGAAVAHDFRRQADDAAVRVDFGRGAAFVRVDFADAPAAVFFPGVDADLAELGVVVLHGDAVRAFAGRDVDAAGAQGIGADGRRGDGVVVDDFAAEAAAVRRDGDAAVVGVEGDFVGFGALGEGVIVCLDGADGGAFARAHGDLLGAGDEVIAVRVFAAHFDVEDGVVLGGAVQADDVARRAAFAHGFVARRVQGGGERCGVRRAR